MLRGQDPRVGDEYVVISAHYDHIGRFHGHIFNGADDNASGCATLLLLADHFRQTRHKRGLMFLWLTGEEDGLLGSNYFIGNPPIPIERIVANINMDMIGRNGPGSIGVIPAKVDGISTLNQVLERVNGKLPVPFSLNKDLDQFHHRSDHFNFFQANIPAIFFFAGVHDDYHSPLDDWDRLDYRKLGRFYELVRDFTREVLDAPQRPAFIENAERHAN